MTLEEELLKDTQLASASDAQLSSLSKMVNELKTVESEILDLEQRAKDLAEKKRKLSQEDIPNFMSNLGFSELSLSDGTLLEVKPVIKCSIPREQKEATLDWMRSNNAGDLIKNELTLDLGRGDDEMAAEIIEAVMEKFGKVLTKESNVHWQTLNAWAKEQISKGVKLPSDLFTLFMYSEARLKAPKK